MTLDPEAARYVQYLASFGAPPVEDLTPEQARLNTRTGTPAITGVMEEIHRREDRVIAGVRCRIVAPEAASEVPVFVYIHGGGWVTGDLDTHEGICRGLANRTGCIVVAPDYRLAPENPFPAALDDCWAVTEWLTVNAREIGGNPARIAVGGDSAGGNLAAVVARRARDQGKALRLQVLVYPVTNSDLDTLSYVRNADGYLLTRKGMAWYWDQYVPQARDRAAPDASPMRAADVNNVSRALVIVCEYDPLLDEGEDYAAKLASSGVPVRLIYEEGMIHGFIRAPALISRARKSWDEIAVELRRAFA